MKIVAIGGIELKTTIRASLHRTQNIRIKKIHRLQPIAAVEAVASDRDDEIVFGDDENPLPAGARGGDDVAVGIRRTGATAQRQESPQITIVNRMAVPIARRCRALGGFREPLFGNNLLIIPTPAVQHQQAELRQVARPQG